MTGEQVHKCSCHNWCGTMQHQRQARQGPGQQKLNESCCKLYTEDIGHNWHGGRDQATRAWRIPISLSIKTTLIIKILSIQTWHVINGAVSVEVEMAGWRDNYGPFYLVTTAPHINTLTPLLKNRQKMTILHYNQLLSFSICIMIRILLHGNWQWNMTLQKQNLNTFHNLQ